MATKSDNPIVDSSEDLLSRGGVAASLAKSIRSADSSAGFVLAVLGPWGSGKTSLINMTRELLATRPAIPVLDFNPWMFSGTEQLVDAFFGELSAQLALRGPKLQSVAEGIRKYSKLLAPLAPIPVIGQWSDRTERALGTVTDWIADGRPSVLELRKQLTEELVKLDQPIVVVIDDIDRLSTSEIRDIFKLVRLTASFPNVIYLLSFDRARVENALEETGISGRDYLEKIVQTSFDLPRVPSRLLMTAFLQAVDNTLDSTGVDLRFGESLWPDVLAEIIWPLVTTMRDVRRYCASIFGTVSDIGTTIELVDVLALEAVRVFLPDVFEALRVSQGALTSTRDLSLPGQSENNEFRRQVEAIITAGDEDAEGDVARALVNRLFPAAGRYIGGSSYGSDWRSNWQKARRVAHSEFLELYFERLAGETIGPFEAAEQLIFTMRDGGDFAARLGAVPKDQLENTIVALESWEREYPADAVADAITALLNITESMPDRRRSMFELGDNTVVVARVVLRMLRALQDESRVNRVVREVLPQLVGPYEKLELIRLVSHREHVGHRLIKADDASELETSWANEVVALSQERLETQTHIVEMFMRAREFGASLPSVELTPEMMRSMLLGARSEVRGQNWGSRAVRRSYRLWWDGLVAVAGSEDVLGAALDQLEASDMASEDTIPETLAIARKYLDGWRPDSAFASDEDDD